MKHFSVCLFLFLSFVCHAQQFSDDYTADYLWGKPYSKKIQEPEGNNKPPQTSDASNRELKVDAALLREQLPKLLDKAWSDPTPENVTNYRMAQKILTDKSTRFADVWQEVNETNPFLSENNSVPIASMGAISVAQVDAQAQDEAIKELAQHSGLFVFVDSRCKYCGIQLQVIKYLKSQYKLDSLIISIDGFMPKGFEDYPFVKDNGLYKRLGLKLTPVTVLVIKPEQRKVTQGIDNNRYLIVSYGFYALDQMVKNISYAAYKSNALSSQIASRMDPWKHGVTSTKDLNNLSVGTDMNFTKAFQPILEKAYAIPSGKGNN